MAKIFLKNIRKIYYIYEHHMNGRTYFFNPRRPCLPLVDGMLKVHSFDGLQAYTLPARP